METFDSICLHNMSKILNELSVYEYGDMHNVMNTFVIQSDKNITDHQYHELIVNKGC